MSATADATPTADAAPAAAAAPMSDVEKIKAAQAERRNRLRRRPQPAATATSASGPPTPPAVIPPGASSSSSSSPPPPAAGDANGDAAAGDAAQQELTTLRLELSSLRRNHLQNIKKLTDERNMFAAQLAKEQNAPRPVRGVAATTAATTKKAADLEVQLRAARTRNNDLEAENAALRDEVKQLNFRVQAGRTMDAASDGYEKVVDELVEAKLKCAQLQEEKEELLRLNKEAMTTSATLTNLNGELEKSRSEWVVRCADLEKKRAELETKLKTSALDAAAKDAAVSQDTSYSGSDLQELKLN